MERGILLMMKIKSTAKIDIGYNMKLIAESKKVVKADVIRELQLAGIPMTKQRYYKLENGLANITADEIMMIAKILECDLSELFKEKITE
jgi:transcriptional regulator with XRE-family HTH domain